MEKVNRKITVLDEALETLGNSIEMFRKCEEISAKNPTPWNDDIALGMRDSMVQRFEYCTDLFWKVLKIYLEQVEKVELEVVSPRSVVRAAVSARIISEGEGEQCMVMVESRNKS